MTRLRQYLALKPFSEIVSLQTSFVQKQLAAASAQTKELFELSTKVTQKTFEILNAATTKAFDQFKRGG